MLLVLALCLPLIQGELPARPRAVATRTQVAPRIDGVLEPEVWDSAPTIGPLTQVVPRTGEPPTEATDVRILYDDWHLYIGVRCHDREPEGIVATQPSRDAELDYDDRLEMVIDTFLDRRSAFYFQMSPAGSKGDALITGDGGDYNKPWDGIWEGRCSIDSQGWTCEMAIPFKTLAFAEGATTWGFNINRAINRKNEIDRWASPTPDAQVFQISRSGDLTGLAGMKQGVGLDVVPFAVGTLSEEHASGHDEDLTGHAGVDAFYRLTPNLTASLTINTDFAETEVDERKVNLTRFPLFFPEKRDFFLQDSGLFKFGGLGNDLIPFFSRRIGLSTAGEEVPILGGAKLTGRQGPWDIALLDVQTDSKSGVDGENLLVSRIAHNFDEHWSLGTLVTRGDPTRDAGNLLYGADASFRHNRGLLGRRFTSSAWFLVSESEGGGGDDGAFGAALGYPNDRWRWSLAAKQIGDDFNPALGFVPRAGVRRYDGSVFFQPRLEGAVRQISCGIEQALVTDLQDDLETASTTARVVGFDFDSGDEARLEVDQVREVLEQPFAITPQVTIPAGTYDDTAARIELETSLKRPLSFIGTFTAGEFLGGESLRWTSSLAARPSALVSLGAEWEQNDIRFDFGDVQTQVSRLRLNFNFTPDLSWNNFVQWDSESDEFGLNSRWRWIPVPGRELYLVYTNVSESTDSLHSLSQQAAIKLAYTVRF